NESASQITADRSVRRRVCPWGRRSPLRSKELWKYRAALHTAFALSKPHKSAASVCGRRRQWLCAPRPSADVFDRYVDRKRAARDLYESRSRRSESVCCASGRRPSAESHGDFLYLQSSAPWRG